MNSFQKARNSHLPKEPDWMKEEWAVDHKIQRRTPTPYPLKDVIKWFITHIFKISKKHENLMSFIPRKSVLNPIESKFSIGFVGDIMKMLGYELDFSEDLYDFFADVELLVGNLEGILTLQPRFITAQRHDVGIMNQLEALKEPDQWLLCLSNNHSGDFGLADFIFHVNRLHWAGFNVFGRKDIPNFLYKNKINIVSGTMWSNQKRAQYISRYSEVDDFFIDSPQIFNILYPHWGYEYERYPRPKIVREAKDLINGWDMIVGHHSHVVQPITRIKSANINKIIAYSLGNLCSGANRKGHDYGIALKCEIGPLKSDRNRLAVGNLEWQFIKSKCDKKLKLRKGMPKVVDPPRKLIKITKKNRFFKNT